MLRELFTCHILHSPDKNSIIRKNYMQKLVIPPNLRENVIESAFEFVRLKSFIYQRTNSSTLIQTFAVVFFPKKQKKNFEEPVANSHI